MISKNKDVLIYLAGQSLQGIRSSRGATETSISELVLKDAKEVLRALKDFTVCVNCRKIKPNSDGSGFTCGPQRGIDIPNVYEHTCESWSLRYE